MCLGVPGLVTKVEGDVVTLDVMGTVRTARLDLLGEAVEVGQWVLHSLGFVTARLDEAEAKETLKLFEQVFASLGEPDVRAPAGCGGRGLGRAEARAMTNDEFWKLIEKAKKKSDGDPEELVDLLRSSLIKLTADEIVSFASIYDEYRHRAYRRDLWGAAFLLNGGCSDDGFEYFRAWLIGQGKATYEAALDNPDSLAGFADPDADDHELEALLSVANEAYEEKTGSELPARNRKAPELTGKEWHEADLDELFPRIAARLGGD